MQDSLWAIHCVWLRYFDVFKKNLKYGITTTFVDPILWLIAFGYGMGGMIGTITMGDQTVSYRKFIFAGVVAQSILFQGFFEGAYGAFIRMYYQRIFKAMATTPITLSEVLWGELAWDATRGTLAATAVLIIGSITGDFSPLGALLCVPVCFITAFLYSALGVWTAGLSQTIEQISYPQYLVVFPMFLFCGVFFPINQMPQVLQTIAWFLPLTSTISIVRSLTLGFPFEWKAVGITLFWLVFLVWVARRTMVKRLIK